MRIRTEALCIIGFTAVLALAGCASSSSRAKTYVERFDSIRDTLDRKASKNAFVADELPEIQKKYEEAERLCSNALADLDLNRRKTGQWQFGASIVGSVAGAVAAPALTAANAAANAAWIAGLSGLSGATNMAQDDFGRYLDSAPDLFATRQTLVQEVLKRIAAYNAAPPNEKLQKVQDLAAACKFYVLVEAGTGDPDSVPK